MKKKRIDQSHLLSPQVMETQTAYVARFMNNPDMSDIFPDRSQRRQIANQSFESMWTDAMVRVTKADGNRFFVN